MTPDMEAHKHSILKVSEGAHQFWQARESLKSFNITKFKTIIVSWNPRK